MWTYLPARPLAELDKSGSNAAAWIAGRTAEDVLAEALKGTAAQLKAVVAAVVARKAAKRERKAAA